MKILLLDIETAPNLVYSWGLYQQNIGINQIVEPGYTICWAAKWLDEKKVHFDSLHHSSHKQMVRGIYDLVLKADAVCHYNGDKFDMPTLNREFIKLDLPPPPKYAKIDLLKAVRKAFKFPSNKLDYVAQELGLGGKVAHTGMQLWIDCMAGDEAAWKLMKRYNVQDVKLLEVLYHRVLPWIDNHPSYAVIHNKHGLVCWKCGSENVVKNGIEHTKTHSYQRYRCKDCGTPMRDRKKLPDSVTTALT